MSSPTSSSGDGVDNVSDVAVVSKFDDAQSPVSEDVNLGSSGDGVANVSHVGAVNIFGDTQSLVSENLSLRLSAATCGSVDANRLGGRKRASSRSGGLCKYLKPQGSLPIFSVGSEGVCNVSSVPIINYDDTCVSDNSSMETAASSSNLDLDGNGRIDSCSQESHDLGLFIKPNMTTAELINAVKSLDKNQVYKLIKHHFVPSETFPFPKEYSAGCNRCFQAKWLKIYSWWLYSKVLDGGFHIFYSLFIKDRSKYGVLVNTPFKKWVKVNKVVGGHSSNQYHHDAMADTNAFLQSVENPEKNVDIHINSILERTIMENNYSGEMAPMSIYSAEQ